MLFSFIVLTGDVDRGEVRGEGGRVSSVYHDHGCRVLSSKENNQERKQERECVCVKMWFDLTN